MKLIKFLMIIGLALATMYIATLAISAIQVARDNQKCKDMPLDQLYGADYLYCQRLR